MGARSKQDIRREGGLGLRGDGEAQLQPFHHQSAAGLRPCCAEPQLSQFPKHVQPIHPQLHHGTAKGGDSSHNGKVPAPPFEARAIADREQLQSPIWIDVRDAALAHVLAAETVEAAGKRFFVTAGYFSNREIVDIIRRNFPEYHSVLPSESAKGGG
ncbi:NAD dependent epimerase/dehydratase [Ilyonectria robusta]